MSRIADLAKAAAAAVRPKWSPELQKLVSKYVWKQNVREGESFRVRLPRTIPKSLRPKATKQGPYGLHDYDGDADDE